MMAVFLLKMVLVRLFSSDKVLFCQLIGILPIADALGRMCSVTVTFPGYFYI